MTETPQPATLTHELHNIPVDKIHKSPHQMRRQFDDQSIRELANSLDQKGLLQPVAVRQMGTAFELVAGERRLRAATLLNWETIPAIVLGARSDEDAAILGLIENLHRVDLDPLEEARGYKQLCEAPYNMTQDAIAVKVGKQKSTICRALALLDLPLEIQEMLPRGNISEAHTRFLRQITDRTQQIELARLIDRQGWSVKETQRRVQTLSPEKAGKNGNKKSNSYFRIAWRGDALKIEATLQLRGEPIEHAISKLKTAVEGYLQSHPSPGKSKK